MSETFAANWNLNTASLPRHLAIIMDGNGRWAAGRKLPRIAGHRKGVERVREIAEFCGKIGIEALTLYAFSDENWRRPEEEVGALMGLLRWYLRAESKRIMEDNVRFRVIGDRKKLSSDILCLIDDLEEATSRNSGMFLTVALSYGGRGEILRAAARIANAVQMGELFGDDLNESIFERYLDTAGLPPVDMLLRTSGEIRISNFLLWQLAYAELFFDDTFWPDFSKEKLVEYLKLFGARERRFGKTPEQVRKARLGASAALC